MTTMPTPATIPPIVPPDKPVEGDPVEEVEAVLVVFPQSDTREGKPEYLNL
jgi:hypothetical protein